MVRVRRLGRDSMAVKSVVAGGVGSLLWATALCAQPAVGVPPAQPAQPGAPHYLLTAPLSGPDSSNSYDFTTSTTQNGPAGTLMVAPTAPPPAYSFADFARNVHGYVSAGISTGGGHDFDGAVNIPLVPGKADLTIAGATGQLGSFTPHVSGQKAGTLHYDAYQIGLHVHPADDFDAYIGISGLNMRSPYPYWRAPGGW
jgi:iron complex outermembrane recepter protein